MNPVIGLGRLPGRILFSVHMGKFSLVDRDEIQETQPKWWDVNLSRLHADVALWTLVTLLIKLICILLKWKYIQRKKIMPFRSLFCESEVILSKTFRLCYPGWIVHIGTF